MGSGSLQALYPGLQGFFQLTLVDGNPVVSSLGLTLTSSGIRLFCSLIHEPQVLSI